MAQISGKLTQGGKLFPSDCLSTPCKFGYSGALSSDGNDAVLGMRGSFWRFHNNAGQWQQVDTLFSAKTIPGCPLDIGYSVAMSQDGNIIVAGAPDYYNISPSTGLGYVFERVNNILVKTQLKGSGFSGGFSIPHILQGYSVAISGDGNTIAIGGPGDSMDIGAVWIFVKNGSSWVQQGAKLVVTDYVTKPYFGNAVSLSYDGNILAVGGIQDRSTFMNVNGSAWIFKRTGTTWNEAAKLDAEGYSVSVSGDGSTVAVGCPFWYGCVKIYTYSSSTWIETASLKDTKYTIGYSVSLSKDGKVLAEAWDRVDSLEPFGAVFAAPGWSETYLDGVSLNTQNHTGFTAISADASTIMAGFYGSAGGVWPFTKKVSDISELTRTTDLLVYPNPFGETTTLRYNLPPSTRQAILNIYDTRGSLVKSQLLDPSSTTATISADMLGNGVYIWDIVVDGISITKSKIVVIK